MSASDSAAAASLATSPYRARFNPLIRPYLVVTIGCTMAITVIGIPLAIIWLLGVGQWWARHYFDLLECELSDRAIRFRKGILFQEEKTIPLENIQDVTFVEGPVLRHFHLSTLKFETAGGSAAHLGNMQLTGIMDAREFRNMILAARERLKHGLAPAPAITSATLPGAGEETLAVLRRIEARLDEIAARMAK